jgi:outer membrane protein, heavy metal efflux system
VDLTASAATIEARRAPTQPNGRLTYDQALTFALGNAATIHQARGAYASAVAAARTARVRPAMTLTLTAEYSKDSDPQRPWLYGGVLDIPIDRSGARESRIDTAGLAILKAHYDLIEAVWTTRVALRRALLDRDVFERRVSAGEDARPMALTAATELALSTQRQIQARGALAQAQSAIAAAMGLTSEALADVEIVSGPDTAPAPSDLRQLRRDAAIGRADVLRAVIDYDTAEQALRTAVAGQYPQVTIGPGYTWERGLTKLPFNLALALPPLDLNRAAIKEAETRRLAAGSAVEAVQVQVYAQTDAAAAALAAAETSLARVDTQDLPLSRRTAVLTERAVTLGELDRTEAVAAQASVLDAELSLIDARRLRATALADLEAATRHTSDPAELTLLSDAVTSLERMP